MNRLNILSIIAAICSGGRTNRYSAMHAPASIRSSRKRGGGRGRRARITRNSLPGNLRCAGDYFRVHPELCRKAAA